MKVQLDLWSFLRYANRISPLKTTPRTCTYEKVKPDFPEIARLYKTLTRCFGAGSLTSIRSIAKRTSLWIDMSRNSTYEPLKQLGLGEFMLRIAKAAHIQKRVTPYTLRHSRLTDLARESASEALLSLVAGWKPGSKMPAVYIHLSKRDQKPALQKILGIVKQEEPKDLIRPKTCSSCKTTNPNDLKICSVCRTAL